MIKHEVTQIGNPIIRRKSKKVADVSSDKVKRIVRDLIDSMRFHGLVGMAAPQIGSNFRIFVSEIRETKTRKKQKKADSIRIYINPRIVFSSRKKVIGYEGCGSVAYGQLFGPVRRCAEVTVKAQNKQGEIFTLKAKGLLAQVIQHELDHLEGIVFVDRVMNTKEFMSREEYIKRFH